MPIDSEKFGGIEVEVALDFERLERQKRSELPKRMSEVGRLSAEEIAKAEREWDLKYSSKTAEQHAKEFVKHLKTQYRSRVGDAKLALMDGLIDPKEFEARAKEAAQAANKAIRQEIAAGRGSDDASFAVLTGALKDIDKESGRAGLSVGRLNQTFTSLLRQAANLHPAVGQLVNAIGSFAVGGIVMTGVLAGLAALGYAWNKITGEAREARKANLDAIETLDELARKRGLGPGGDLPDTVRDAQSKLEALRSELAAARQRGFGSSSPLAQDRMFGGEGFSRSTQDIEADIEAESEKIRKGVEAGEEAINNAIVDAMDDRRQNEASALAALIAANQATEAEMARARQMIETDNAVIAHLGDENIEQRADSFARKKQLEDAFKAQGAPEAERIKKAEEEAKRAAERLAAAEGRIVTEVARLTASATDELTLAVKRMATEAAEAAAALGVEVSQATQDSLERLRDNIKAIGVLEGFQADLQGISGGGATEDAQHDLELFIGRLEDEIVLLDDGSVAQGTFNDLLRRAIDLREKNAGAIDRETEAEKRKRLATEADAEREKRDALRDLRDRARLIEENARAAIQLANAFGGVSDETAQALENIVQLGSAVFRITKSMGPGMEFDFSAVSVAIGAVAQLAKGLFGGGGEAEREMIRAMGDLEEALKSLEGAVKGDLSATDQDRLIGGTKQLLKHPSSPGFTVQAIEGSATYRFLEEVAAAVGANIDSLVNADSSINFEALAKALEGLEGLSLGIFGDDLLGRLDAMNFVTSQLGDHAGTAAEKLHRFLDVIGEAEGGKAGNFANALRKKFDEEGAEAADAFIDSIAQRFAANDQSLFADGGLFAGLNANEVRRLLEEGNGLIEDLIRGGPGGSTNDFVQARSITTIQAGRLEGAAYTQNALGAEANGLLLSANELSATGNDLLRQLVALHVPNVTSLSQAGGVGSLGTSFAPSGGSNGQVSLSFSGPLIGEIKVTGTAEGKFSSAATQQIGAEARKAARVMADELNRELGALKQGRLRAQGRQR